MADLIYRDEALDAIPMPTDSDEAMYYSMITDMIEAVPAVNRWIPVEDALPDTLQNVLVCTDINTVTVAWINGEGWTFADTGNGHTENWTFEAVKYWMPLPEPPEKE